MCKHYAGQSYAQRRSDNTIVILLRGARTRLCQHLGVAVIVRRNVRLPVPSYVAALARNAMCDHRCIWQLVYDSHTSMVEQTQHSQYNCCFRCYCHIAMIE